MVDLQQPIFSNRNAQIAQKGLPVLDQHGEDKRFAITPFGQPLLGPCNVSSAVRRRSKSVIATLLRSGASYLEPAAERISREGSATRSGSLRSGAKVAAKVRSVLAAASTAAAASASWPV